MVLERRVVVPVRREAHYSFAIKVNFHWPHLRDEHVNAHVPLGLANEHGLCNVLLDDALLVVVQVGQVVDYRNAPTPAQVGRLADPDVVLLGTAGKGFNKLLVLVGEEKSYWDEVVNVAEHVAHLFDESRKIVFCAENAGLWKVN